MSLPSEIDCAIINSDINRRYFCGMKSSAGYILAFREKTYLLIDFRYIEKAKSVVKNCEVILLTSIKTQADELFKKHNAKVLAVESETLTVSSLTDFEKMFEGFEIDASNNLSSAITALRSVKTNEEIEKITTAQRIAEKAFENVLNFIKVGKTEKEIALELDFFMLKNGAESISFETIALTGENTALPHGVPSDKEVRNGDFVLMDFGAVYDGFHSDMTRTICVGQPTEKMKSVYEIVLDAQNRSIEKVKSGIYGADLDKIARDIISNAGFGENFGHSLGHGVGMEIHEFPTASPTSKAILEENMVITIEPGIYLPREFGVRIEDFVVIKQNSCQNITKCDKKLLCI